jgi:hypothetical protein
MLIQKQAPLVWLDLKAWLDSKVLLVCQVPTERMEFLVLKVFLDPKDPLVSFKMVKLTIFRTSRTCWTHG